MQRATKDQVAAYLRAIGAPPPIVRGALGDYGDNSAINPVPPNTYGAGVFNAPSAAALQAREPAPVQPFVANNTKFSAYFLQIGTAQGSVNVLPSNNRRTLVLFQNQSTATNMYINFAQDAGLNQGLLLAPGVGVFFDYVCPSDSINVFFNNATPQPGLVLEGAPVS